MLLRGKQASGLLTQQKMLRAAVKLFLEKRYEGTTTAEIASTGMMRSFVAVPCDMYFTVERKIARFLECAFRVYNVSPERRRGSARPFCSSICTPWRRASSERPSSGRKRALRP